MTQSYEIDWPKHVLNSKRYKNRNKKEAETFNLVEIKEGDGYFSVFQTILVFESGHELTIPVSFDIFKKDFLKIIQNNTWYTAFAIDIIWQRAIFVDAISENNPEILPNLLKLIEKNGKYYAITNET